MKRWWQVVLRGGAGVGLGLLLALPVIAEPAAEFTLADAAGREVSLADYRGQPLVLHFWATWCPYCKKVQPGLDRLRQRHSGQDLVVLGISFREDEGAEPQAVLQQRGLGFSTLVAGGKVAERYGVRGTPTTFFIDREGDIRGFTSTSNPDDPELEALAEVITAR